jgi:hypothetical protein
MSAKLRGNNLAIGNGAPARIAPHGPASATGTRCSVAGGKTADGQWTGSGRVVDGCHPSREVFENIALFPIHGTGRVNSEICKGWTKNKVVIVEKCNLQPDRRQDVGGNRQIHCPSALKGEKALSGNVFIGRGASNYYPSTRPGTRQPVRDHTGGRRAVCQHSKRDSTPDLFGGAP